MAIDCAYLVHVDEIGLFGSLQPEVPILMRLKRFVKPAAMFQQAARKQRGVDCEEPERLKPHPIEWQAPYFGAAVTNL